MGQVDNLQDLGKEIRDFANGARFKIGGPAYFDWGYDSSPNISFWYKDRRVHFYFHGEHGRIYIVAEAAEVGPPRRVKATRIQTSEEAWIVAERWLRQRVDFDGLPGDEWVSDFPAVDVRVPHPPGEVPEGEVSLTGKIEDVAPQEASPRPRPPLAAAPASPARLVGVGAVTLYSNDPAKLAAWYEKVLGIRFEEQEGAYLGALGTSGMSFSIYRAQTLVPEGTRPVMLNLRVTSFDAMLADMVGKGAEMLGLDQTKLGKFAWTRDGDGNPLEIWGE